MAAISTNPALRVSHAPPSTHDEDRSPAKSIDEPGLSSESDGDGDDSNGLFNDLDEVQSLFQPSLSPAATRLASPSTPAAERAAALDKLPDGGLFSVMEDARAEASRTPTPPGVEDASAVSTRQGAKPAQRPKGSPTQAASSSRPFYQDHLPSPWQNGPKKLIVEDGSGAKSPLSGVFSQSRIRRSSSGGAEAFKKLRDALPSLNLPTHLFQNLTSPSFFSGTSQKQQDAETKAAVGPADGAAETRPVSSAPEPASPPAPAPAPTPDASKTTDQAAFTNHPKTVEPAAHGRPSMNGSLRPPSVASTRPRLIRRSTSDDSLLYNSLSRVSSYGDDDRWGNVREQTNARFKAIKDSWDRPTFKMPQLPNMIPAPLKRSAGFGSDSSSPQPSPAMPNQSFSSKDGNLTELDEALEHLTGDIVIMGGYRGSVLRSTKTKRQVWVPVKVGLNIRKVNLEVGLNPEDEERMEETIYPSGMLQNIGPVDISRKLFKRLRECENAKNGTLRIWDYGWDWRLSPHLLSRKLIAYLEKLPCNQPGYRGDRGATVIAHSLGGLITRHAVNQRPELFAGVLFAGTPQRCINILGPVRNGDAVLLNEKVLTARVNFTLRTTFVFLPEDGYCFINKHTGEEYRVDFYEAEQWAKHRLSPCIEPPLPPYNVRQSSLGSFLNLSGTLPNIPGRSRGNSAPSESRTSPTRNSGADAARQAEADQGPQMQVGTVPDMKPSSSQSKNYGDVGSRERNMEYLKRTLADTKKFRAELAHQQHLADSNAYPPFAVIYGKDIPTVYAVHVTCRDAIACSDVYDDLLFRSGDGVVLAREAMLPPGYEIVKGGRISTDRGHITMLGDFNGVGQALKAMMRGRRKGLGLGTTMGTKRLSSSGEAPSL